MSAGNVSLQIYALIDRSTKKTGDQVYLDATIGGIGVSGNTFRYRDKFGIRLMNESLTGAVLDLGRIKFLRIEVHALG